MTALSPSVRLKELLGAPRNLADLPNSPGFEFRGLTKDGIVIECEVKIDPVGCCSAYVKHTNDPCFFRLAGWYPVSEHPECSICRRRHGLEKIHECE